MRITIAARASPLSQVQVKEVWEELKVFYPDMYFDVTWVKTIGDRDRTTSLRTLDKTDFFTREIDQLLLERKVQAGIHSAKDLPDPLPNEIQLAAITKGIDSRDSLVLREGVTFDTLPFGSIIATSSFKREEAVKALRTDFKFQDIRGTIEERLDVLYRGEVDGVVIAEAALIRLGLSALNRLYLPGETTKGQGRLAVTVHESEIELKRIFNSINSENHILDMCGFS